MKEHKRLSSEDKQKVWSLYQKGVPSREIAEEIGCSVVSVCKWIKFFIKFDGNPPLIQYEKVPRRKANAYIKHKGPKCQDQSKGIFELYEKFRSANRVSEELKLSNILINPLTIFKRVRDYVKKHCVNTPVEVVK